MSFYSRMSSTASKLLTDYGQEAVFTRRTETGFDAATGSPTETTTSITLTVVSDSYNAAEIDGNSIHANDVRLYAKASTEPLIGDESSKYGKILSVQQIEPGGSVLMYVIQCRT